VRDSASAGLFSITTMGMRRFLSSLTTTDPIRPWPHTTKCPVRPSHPPVHASSLQRLQEALLHEQREEPRDVEREDRHTHDDEPDREELTHFGEGLQQAEAHGGERDDREEEGVQGFHPLDEGVAHGPAEHHGQEAEKEEARPPFRRSFLTWPPCEK